MLTNYGTPCILLYDVKYSELTILDEIIWNYMKFHDLVYSSWVKYFNIMSCCFWVCIFEFVNHVDRMNNATVSLFQYHLIKVLSPLLPRIWYFITLIINSIIELLHMWLIIGYIRLIPSISTMQ
jgi:hypothetical protein